MGSARVIFESAAVPVTAATEDLAVANVRVGGIGAVLAGRHLPLGRLAQRGEQAASGRGHRQFPQIPVISTMNLIRSRGNA